MAVGTGFSVFVWVGIIITCGGAVGVLSLEVDAPAWDPSPLLSALDFFFFVFFFLPPPPPESTVLQIGVVQALVCSLEI